MKFFHKVAAGRGRRNVVREIEFDAIVLVRDPQIMAEEVTKFYKGLYYEEVEMRCMELVLRTTGWDAF